VSKEKTCSRCGEKKHFGYACSVFRKNSDLFNVSEATSEPSLLTESHRTQQLLERLIKEQQLTRFALGALGIILLVAFYVIGVKVNLSPTSITPYP